MDHNKRPSVLLLLLTVLVPVLVTAAGQSCTMPTRDTIHQLLTSHVVSVSSGGQTVNVTLTQHAISCAAPARILDTYMYVSVAISFQTNSTGVPSCSPSTDCIGFFHIVCNDQLSSWILDEIVPESRLELDNSAPVDMEEPRTNCGVCSHNQFFTPDFDLLYDHSTHCYSTQYLSSIIGVSMLCVFFA